MKTRVIFLLQQTSILSVLILISSLTILGQKNEIIHFNIQYVNEERVDPNGTVKVGFRPENGYWSSALGMPFFQTSRKVSFNSVSAKIINVQTAILSSQELKLIDKNQVDFEFEIVAEISSARHQKYLFTYINSVRKNIQTGIFEKLLSFDVQYVMSNKSKISTKAFASNSVLTSGNGTWYKFGIVEDGIHKISASALSNDGLDLIGTASDRLNIYGNGQGMLSIFNGSARFDDLIKNSIKVVDGGDGIFDAADYILFYAKGPHSKSLSGVNFIHETNNYSDTSYYYLNVSSSISPKRLTAASQSNLPTTDLVNTFNEFQFFEEDRSNLNKSGQEWYGDLYDAQTTYSYPINVNNLSGDSIRLTVQNIIQSTSNSVNYTVSAGSSSMVMQASNPSGQGYLAAKGVVVNKTMNYYSTQNQQNITITLNKNGFISSKGYQDYIELNYQRNLTMSGGQMEFTKTDKIGAGKIVEYQVSNGSSVNEIWEVTDPRNARLVATTNSGGIKYFKVAADSLRIFVAHNGSQFKTPQFVGEVASQNLHGMAYADMIIISDPLFLSAANRLSAFHATEGVSCLVVTPSQIFNEFSSGMRDPVAIRHFLKMFYDRANGDPNLIPKSCLLFGDCSFDFRNRLNSNSDYVITYESTQSLSTTSTYASDDFFAILDDNGSMNNTDLMDLSIGRLPVESAENAEIMVDKVIKYSEQNSSLSQGEVCLNGTTPNIYRDWRNIVVMVSDDGDNNAYFSDVEIMDNILKTDHPDLSIIKIHTDAYLESVTPGGERNEGAQKAIKERVDRGALIVNYIGHGGELGWAHESILDVPTIQNWDNTYSLPIFLTATCEFSRYDDHDRVSAGEYVLLNPNGGGIGLFTTTRLVFSSSNEKLARFFYDTVADQVNFMPQTLGQVAMGTKNKFALSNSGGDFRKFTFLGDPSIRLAAPQHNVIADSVNGVDINIYNDTLKALSQVTISGHLEDNQGQPMSSFDGFVYPTIYDKESQLSTLGNSSNSFPADYEMWQNVVYKGKASVINGQFSFTFIVPQDISYDIGASKISFYATDDINTDANGENSTVKIGGINTNATADTEGPTVLMYLNNEQFVNGGVANESPVLLANIFDENGINTVGNGIGHNIEIRLDDNSETIILNDYYEADLDTYQSGKIAYALDDIAPGEHTLYLKVWDVFNNSSDGELTFTVVAQEDIAIEHLINYPNPFTTNTEFSFEHNQVCDYLDVQIQVFTITGTVVKTINQRIISNGFRVDKIQWDGRDDFGEKIGIGTYIYKLTVETESGENLEKFEKLVILN
jgi:hypothetical protein